MDVSCPYADPTPVGTAAVGVDSLHLWPLALVQGPEVANHRADRYGAGSLAAIPMVLVVRQTLDSAAAL